MKDQPGFTFVELLIVAAIMMVLMGLSVPFVSSLHADIALHRTIRQVKTDFLTNMTYAMSGKSIASLSARSLENADLIPGYYVLHFQRANDYGGDDPYYYLELSSKIGLSGNEEAKPIYQLAKEMPSPAVYLKEIRLKTNGADSGTSVASASIFFAPPLGKIFLTTGVDGMIDNAFYSFDPLAVFRQGNVPKTIELVFQYKNETDQTVTLSFGTDKIINVL